MKYLILMHVDPEVMASLTPEQQQGIGAGHLQLRLRPPTTPVSVERRYAWDACSSKPSPITSRRPACWR